MAGRILPKGLLKPKYNVETVTRFGGRCLAFFFLFGGGLFWVLFCVCFVFCFVNCRAPVPLLSLKPDPLATPPAHPMPRPARRAAPTFLFVLGLSLRRPPAPRQAEGALAGEAGAAGVEGSCDPAFLLPPLFPLQAGRKSTAHRVAQPLALWEEVELALATPCCRPDAGRPGFQQLGDPESLHLSWASVHNCTTRDKSRKQERNNCRALLNCITLCEFTEWAKLVFDGKTSEQWLFLTEWGWGLSTRGPVWVGGNALDLDVTQFRYTVYTVVKTRQMYT